MNSNPQFWVLQNSVGFEEFIEFITNLYEKTGYVEIEWTTARSRTARQNRALHVYFRLLGEALNDAGLDQRKVLKPSIDIPWTTESTKNHLFRPIMEAMFEINSTRKLERKQVSEVYDVLNENISTRYGVHVAFPEDRQ